MKNWRSAHSTLIITTKHMHTNKISNEQVCEKEKILCSLINSFPISVELFHLPPSSKLKPRHLNHTAYKNPRIIKTEKREMQMKIFPNRFNHSNDSTIFFKVRLEYVNLHNKRRQSIQFRKFFYFGTENNIMSIC